MAFDQPLEADKVGENSLVSLISGPIVGTIMWVLEGGKKKDEEDLRRWLTEMMLDDVNESPESRCPGSPLNKEKTLPRLVRSEFSVSTDAEENASNMQPKSLMPRFHATASLLYSNTNNSTEKIGKTKKMSWSENLVEYCDDEVSSGLLFVPLHCLF
jgi:hypothetical protein